MSSEKSPIDKQSNEKNTVDRTQISQIFTNLNYASFKNLNQLETKRMIKLI